MKTELVFILDKSGSMSGLETDTIGGYNAMLAKQQAIAGDCRLTTVLFADKDELLHDRMDLQAVHPLTTQEYQVGGTTALLDAIGRTIYKIANVPKDSVNGHGVERVLFVIITDGEENASREYTAEKVKTLIEQQKKEAGWEFIFLGANIDAIATANRFGISPNRTADYLADSVGIELNYQVMAQTVTTFRETGKVDEACFDEIRHDVKQRIKQRLESRQF